MLREVLREVGTSVSLAVVGAENVVLALEEEAVVVVQHWKCSHSCVISKEEVGVLFSSPSAAIGADFA